MKGVRYYALLSGSLLFTLSPMSCLADDKTSPSDTEDKPVVNETDAGHQRGITLDQLFALPYGSKIPQAAQQKAKHAASKQASAAPAQVTSTLKVAPHHLSKQPTIVVKQNSPPVQATAAQATASTSASQKQAAPSSSTIIAGQSDYIAVSNSTTSSPVISVALNKPGITPKYHPGDKLVIDVTASTDCNLTIFDYDSQGTLTQLFPNDYQSDTMVKAGQVVRIGGPESKYDFEVTGPGGLERIFVYAYPSASASPVTVAMRPIPNTPFRSVEMTADDYSRMVQNAPVHYGKIPVASGRGVKVVAKDGVKESMIMNTSDSSHQPNKMELTFQVDSK